ncbi:MAG: T9SS type A sorting domain-containing protein [Sphingobacteriales bacterium]|nr:MAG: T9SS type A sorting domain-containing protein [Sphingobacteriales bacterium]
MKLSLYLIPAIVMVQTASAQFAPQAGVAGTTAISKSSAQIKGWASGCTVERGWLDIADPSKGSPTIGLNSDAVGAADNSVISLGDSGVAVLTFSSPIYNGAGADFAVFENGFINPSNKEEAFLELAFVEVSSDGINYFRFPAASYTPETTQVPGAGVYLDAKYINNLAGKYSGGYGTPFDLEELAGKPGLDINQVTHVRVVDVIGSVSNNTSLDTSGRKINDPYPTPFPGGGFDLDAVGAIYLRDVGVDDFKNKNLTSIYPNPVADYLNIQLGSGSDEPISLLITDVTGKVLSSTVLSQPENKISFTAYHSGIYYLQFSDAKGNKWVERITKL